MQTSRIRYFSRPRVFLSEGRNEGLSSIINKESGLCNFAQAACEQPN
jgi:hypothetical protein